MSARAESIAPGLPGWIVPAGCAFGCAALLLRPSGPSALVGTGVLGLLGAAISRGGVERRIESARLSRVVRWLAVVAPAVTVFAALRFFSPVLPPRTTAVGVFGLVLAGVAEELFFRRFVYGAVERHGPVVAISVSAALFAIIHVPQYGSGVLPIDFAAGCLLGWQRYATGGWTAPGVTHVVANLLMMG